MPARVLLAEGTKPDTRVRDQPCQFGDRRAAVGLQHVSVLPLRQSRRRPRSRGHFLIAGSLIARSSLFAISGVHLVLSGL